MKDVKKRVIKGISKGSHKMTSGDIVFSLGILLVIVASLVATYATNAESLSTFAKATTVVFMILGIVIGILNVTGKETNSFLLASMVLVLLLGPFLGNLIQTYQMSGNISTLLGEIFKNVIALVVPAAIVVAGKSLFATAHDE